MDEDWAATELGAFARVAVPHISSFAGPHVVAAYSLQGNNAIAERAAVVEPILDRVLPHWREQIPASGHDRWQQHREAAARVSAMLSRAAELRDKLGDQAPALSAGSLHPWVWHGAASMWAMAAYDRAVEDALARVNYEAQRKSGVDRVGETKLFQALFSTDAPGPGSPRLRLEPAEGVTETPDTFRSRHLAVHALAQGLFAGLRNPAAHGVRTSEGDQQAALERLAAVSVLARWVDGAVVEATGTGAGPR